MLRLTALAALATTASAKCTSMAFGAGATVEGSPAVTHNADCKSCDFRIGKVPAREHDGDAKRRLYEYRGEYPMLVTEERGRAWSAASLDASLPNAALLEAKASEASLYVASVDEVASTHALLEAQYGVLNEHGLAMGESTCAHIFYALPASQGGKAKFEVRGLSQVAMERATTAREAIRLMGELATEHGFYGAAWDLSDMGNVLLEAGETLTVSDPTEAWVFHVGPDDTQESAVWAAQRVPAGHVAAVGNQWVIRTLEEGVGSAPDGDYMYGAGLFDVARRNNLLEADGTLDWAKAFTSPHDHAIYATRRVWRVFNLAAPSLALPGDTDDWGSDYPFSVPVDAPMDFEAVFAILRDHYEGTPYDLTKGLAAGPFGDPARFDATGVDGYAKDDIVHRGTFERAISMFRTSYSFVAVSRPKAKFPVVYWGAYAPHATSFVPLYVHADDVPLPVSTGSLFRYDDTSLFWAFAGVGNYASRFYRYAMVPVHAAQAKAEARMFAAAAVAERKAAEAPTPEAAAAVLGQASAAAAEGLVHEWRALFHRTIAQFRDGYFASDSDLKSDTINPTSLFYPMEWLKGVGFFDAGKTPPPLEGASLAFATAPAFAGTVLMGGLVAAVFTVGVVVGARREKEGRRAAFPQAQAAYGSIA